LKKWILPAAIEKMDFASRTYLIEKMDFASKEYTPPSCPFVRSKRSQTQRRARARREERERGEPRVPSPESLTASERAKMILYPSFAERHFANASEYEIKREIKAYIGRDGYPFVNGVHFLLDLINLLRKDDKVWVKTPQFYNAACDKLESYGPSNSGTYLLERCRKDHVKAVGTLYAFAKHFRKSRLLELAIENKYIDPKFFKTKFFTTTTTTTTTATPTTIVARKEGRHPIVQQLLDQASRIPNNFDRLGFVDLSTPWETETLTWEDLSELVSLVTSSLYDTIDRDLIVDGVMFSLDVTKPKYLVKQSLMQGLASPRLITPSWIEKHKTRVSGNESRELRFDYNNMGNTFVFESYTAIVAAVLTFKDRATDPRAKIKMLSEDVLRRLGPFIR